MFIYIITNSVNGKKYVGKTINTVEHRWAKHIWASLNKQSKQYHFAFHRAIRKYGSDNFYFEQILDLSDCNITDYDLGQIEIDFIQIHRTFTKFKDSIGYNMTIGGDGVNGTGIQIDSYDKQLNFLKTYVSIEGAARQLGLQSTNIQGVIKGRMKSTGDLIFCEHGDEPTPFTDEKKTSIDIYSKTGQFIITCESMSEASEYIGSNIADVHGCCNEKLLTTKGHICVYHGADILKRRKSKTAVWIDLYDKNTKQLIKTFETMISLMKELKVSKTLVQRCLRTDNHLAGDYLIVPHGYKLDGDIV